MKSVLSSSFPLFQVIPVNFNGGRFLLHIINRDWVILNFQSSDWCDAGSLRILEQRGFDYATSTSTDKWTLIRDGKETVHHTAIRMYSYHELIDMFKRVGFTDIEGYGSEKLEPISRDSRMMFVIGTRPKN